MPAKQENIKFGQIMFLGQMRDVEIDLKTKRKFSYNGVKFIISKDLASNHGQISNLYNQFCENELKKIINKQVGILRYKKIQLDDLLLFKGKKILPTKTISVNDYLKLLEFSPKLDYKIGNYEREWGINEINPKEKKFTLFFNLNLIKFDKGQHINYVVAHELTHVFFRDHGPEFNKALERLFPQKSRSEDFFTYGLAAKFGSTPSWFLIGFLIFIAIVYLIYQNLYPWFLDLFNFNQTPEQKFY